MKCIIQKGYQTLIIACLNLRHIVVDIIVILNLKISKLDKTKLRRTIAFTSDSQGRAADPIAQFGVNVVLHKSSFPARG